MTNRGKGVAEETAHRPCRMPMNFGTGILDQCLDRSISDPIPQRGAAMDIPVTQAKARLSELMRRAQAGEEIVLTRHGKPAARIVPAAPPPDQRARRALIASVQAAARQRIKPGPTAARSQDFLYDERGLPN